MLGVVIFPVLIVGGIVLIAKRKKPNPRVLLVVPPGHKFNRLQHLGLSYLILGVVFFLIGWQRRRTPDIPPPA